MYEPYWGLKSSPFRNDCDARFFFRSRGHQAALLKLRYLIEHDHGGGVLVGDCGLGKTYLTQLLSRELPDTAGPIVRIVFPQLSAFELLAYLAAELGAEDAELAYEEGRLDRVLRQIVRQLKKHVERGKQPVLIIDDSHLVEDFRVFQALQQLLNFQHHKPQVAFSLILVGEPIVLGRLRRLTQLNERLGIKSSLQPLTIEETHRYVHHRLNIAGSQAEIFDESAIAELHAASAGIPRRINRLCDLALLVGYADKIETISARQIEAVAEELTTVVPC